MVTRTFLSLVAAGALLLQGCGDGDKAGAKQAALAPAKSAKGVKPPPAADVEETAAKSAAKPTAKPALTPAMPAAKVAETAVVDSSGAPAQQDESLGRDSFAYTGGSRDPFVSLLSTTRLGPELPDLVLVAIYYDTRNPAASVVVMREKIGNRKYNLRTGDRLGRMRVTAVQPKDVSFTIDDFGTERQETVSLRKQEDNR